MMTTSCVSIMSMGGNYVGENDVVNSALNDADNKKLQALFPRMPLRRIPRYARMGLLASTQALEGIDAHARIGLVVGTAYAGIQMSMDFMDSILDAEPRLSSPTAFSHAVNNMGAGLLSLYLNIQGPCHTVTQFDLSFVGALQTAITLVQAQRAEYVLVGCMDEKEERFSKVCTTQPDSLVEGAVFFLVGKVATQLPKLSLTWRKQDANMQTNTSFLEGETALHHAINTLEVLQEKKSEKILCKSKHTDMCATIIIES